MSQQSTPSIPDPPWAVVLTALSIESEAVREHLHDVRYISDRHGTQYACGTFSCSQGKWNVAVAECGPGNTYASQIANNAIQFFSPRLLFFVGVAGALKDLSLGDVVASTKVYNIHSGKAEGDFRPRPAVENTSFRLEQMARRVANEKFWISRLIRSHPDACRDPCALVAPIAAGEQVVADELSMTYKMIRQNYSDAVAVEMEGYGVLAAANIPKVDAIVIRGISDKVVDKEEADGKGWQPFAAHNASAFMFEMLSLYAIGPEPHIGHYATPLPANSLPPSLIPNIAISGLSIRQQFDVVSSELLAWPVDLGDGAAIFRPEMQIIMDRIASGSFSSTLLLGAPGSGKSALLSNVCRELSRHDHAMLAIKADTLADDIKDASSLRTALGFSLSVSGMIRELASVQPVVLVVDQLDALADLVDLKPGRLNSLLNLIRELKDSPGVHIVCSCREFEYRHDARLTAIDSDVVRLTLPTWEQAAEILKNRGLNTYHWPAPFKELLRTPLHLKVFLQCLSDDTEHKTFVTYQEMLDELWAKKITNPNGPAGRSELIMDIAKVMAQRETLWVPAALFEGRRQLIEHLAADGILTGTASTSGIGFSHQTFFEHARARGFAREIDILSDYILARQHGLFIRPTLWASLTYLRHADPSNYRREFGRIWNESSLRSHIRHLMIEFLGVIPDPDLQEQKWILEALGAKEFRARVLKSIRGNLDWFNLLSRSHLLPLMREFRDDSDMLVGILIAALRENKSETLVLLRSSWLGDKAKDKISWHVLNFMTDWNVDDLDLLTEIYHRTEIGLAAGVHAAIQIAQTAPSLASKFTAKILKKELMDLEAQDDPVFPSPSADVTEEQLVYQKVLFKPKVRFQKLIEDVNGWQGIEEVAEKAPLDFLEPIWPIFIRALEHIVEGRHQAKDRFFDDYCLGLQLDSTNHGYPLPDAIDLAIKLVAQDFPEEFIAFLNREKNRPYKTLQRLFARGIAHLPSSYSNVGLLFLIDDTRRFKLGSISDEYTDSTDVIKRIGPHLTDTQFSQLEATILEWTMLDSKRHDVADRLMVGKINRRHRLRLLQALPFERISPAVRDTIRDETAEFPDHANAGVSHSRAYFVRSPMTEQQMKLARNADIVNLFRTLNQKRTARERNGELKGGIPEASRALEAFAAANPERALSVVDEFRSDIYEYPVSAVVVGLSNSTCSDRVVFDTIIDLDKRGFRGLVFRSEAARALRARTKDGIGLPDEICMLLNIWLSENKIDSEGHGDPQSKEIDSDFKSIIWDARSGRVINQGSYQILEALTYGYLLREPRSTNQWLSSIRAHLERPESFDNWLVFTNELRYLHLCNESDAMEFLDRLFEKYPGMFETVEGVVLLALSNFPIGRMVGWYESVKKSTWKMGRQAYGELVGLRYLQTPSESLLQQIIESSLSDSSADASDVQRGIAFSAANMWAGNSRKTATELLERLISKNEPAFDQPAMDIFIKSESLACDEFTHRILLKCLENPAFIFRSENAFFIEHLEKLLPNEAEVIYRLLRAMLHQFRDRIKERKTWTYYFAHMTNVALTLHRLEDPFRSYGLELFEDLLAMHIADAEEALREIDMRPGSRSYSRASRKRRQRKIPNNF